MTGIIPRISIALCTCDGDHFLSEQLYSLLAQTYPPYELVVCDDASQDGSVAILETFATQAPFPVRITRNPHRIGISANFEQAINLCGGDVIAICDQDDVWQPSKLELFAEMFAEGMDWVCCDAEVSDSDLHSLGYTLWQRVNFDHAERELAQGGHFLDVLIKHFVVAGATLAFKSQARDKLLPIPHGWLYDAWIAMILAATGSVGLEETPLQRYRQHRSNALGASQRSLLFEARVAFVLDRHAFYAEEIARWNALIIRLGELGAPETTRGQVNAKIAHLRRRAALPANRLARLPAVVAEILNGGYARYARNWGSIALDLLVK